MLPRIDLDPQSSTPLYRQLHEKIRSAIADGKMARGERIPPTRELAQSIGLNRATITAAFDVLESEGLIRREVGRGSFVTGATAASAVPQEETPSIANISFSASRPSEIMFPLDEFRATCREVIDSDEASQILQLGPASGYGPLRRYLLNEARKRGNAGPEDDILVTSGCQQAFDLIQRVLAARGETVLIEDPVYPGLRNAFLRGGARVIGMPAGRDGVDIEALGSLLDKEKPRLLVLTPNFQNPTGSTMPAESRKTVLMLAKRAGVIVVENDLYGELRYYGAEVPTVKKLDESGETILLGSFSKVAFPGLRVGWAIGPRHFIARLTEAKEASDLHSDQLSQAVLLRFAESGRLAAHREKMRTAGALRLAAILSACEKELPAGSIFTRPEGGMNVWVELPSPLDASELAMRAERENVSFLPGRYFAVTRPQVQGLRLSFAGLTPENIRHGLAVLGTIFRTELERAQRKQTGEPAPALV
jgi:DNA-binding transcriptional MocR family regulator